MSDLNAIIFGLTITSNFLRAKFNGSFLKFSMSDLNAIIAKIIIILALLSLLIVIIYNLIWYSQNEWFLVISRFFSCYTNWLAQIMPHCSRLKCICKLFLKVLHTLRNVVICVCLHFIPPRAKGKEICISFSEKKIR